jgi:arabinofuranan 3-O-arabinosyltransferase
VSEALRCTRTGAGVGPGHVRTLGIFASWRLQAYGYTIVAVYVAALIACYNAGIWFVDSTGTPLLNDFTISWIAGTQALHGEVASLYDTVQFENLQTAVVGLIHFPRVLYPNWPYPPIFFLIVAPLAMLPYVAAFLSWEMATLLGCVVVVFLIVRQPASIALVLASPLTAWNFFEGQSGFLMASLVGAALLALERRPVLAGVFIGGLTFKPQFGILFPVALIAARQWRAFASAAVTAAVLAGVTVAAFGIGPWEAFPRQLFKHTGDFLLQEHPYAIGWIYIQTVYGQVRALHGSAALAWLVHGCAAIGVATIVWLVWRSPVRYSLKAATLSAAMLIATPFSFAYDMAGIVIPLAFLARDQIRCGLLRGEQIIIIALFLAAYAIVATLGYSPLGPVVMITLLGMILRRVLRDGGEWARAIVDEAGAANASTGNHS